MGRGVYPRKPMGVTVGQWGLLSSIDKERISAVSKADRNKALAMVTKLVGTINVAEQTTQETAAPKERARSRVAPVDQMNILAVSLSALSTARKALVDTKASPAVLEESENAILTTQRYMLAYQGSLLGDLATEMPKQSLFTDTGQIQPKVKIVSLLHPTLADHLPTNGSSK